MTAPRHTSLGRASRRTATAFALLVGVGTLLLGAPTAALAHDGLVATSPAGGASLPAPAEIELDFTGEPLPIGTLVAVTGPAEDDVSDGDPEIRGTTVVQRLTDDLPPGAYRVDWRSTSSDGHALTGTFDFTVTPAPGQADAATPTSEAATPGADTASGSTSAGPAVAPVWLVAGAVLVLGLGAWVVAGLRRRR